MKDFTYQNIKKIIYLKRTNSNGTLFNNLPKEFIEYFNYNNNLKFEQEPDYKYLHSLFNNILFELKFNYENMSFSWISLEQINLFKISRNNSMRKTNSHSRLFQKIIEKSEQRAKSENNEKCLKNNIRNNRRSINNSQMAKIKIINNIKNINNINFKNNEKMMTIQSNGNDINKPFKCKKIILKKKIDNSNYVNNYNRNNNKLLIYNSNNNINSINSIKNQISHKVIVNMNPNINNNKKNFLFKNQSKLINKKLYFNRQTIPKSNNTYSNINIFQNSLYSTSKNLSNSSGTNIDYKQYYSNGNSVEKQKINKNSYLKSYIPNKHLKMISPKKQNNKNIKTQRISIIDSKISNKNIDNLNNFEKDKSSFYQNKNFTNNNINIIYIKDNYNNLRNKNIKIPVSHFSNKNFLYEEGKYSLTINQRNKFINLNNKNILNHSPFSINTYNIKKIQNNTYRSIFKRNEGDRSPLSEYNALLYDKYF